MKRRLGPDEVAIWSVVASTVKPMPGKSVPKAEGGAAAARLGTTALHVAPRAAATKRTSSQGVRQALHTIEPNRERRLARGNEVMEARIDLHGMTQDVARGALERFLLRAQAEGYRAALVITGKGVGGDGVLRRRLPDWLLAHPLRGVVAGVSEARRRHGGKGAVYVALKRLAQEWP